MSSFVDMHEDFGVEYLLWRKTKTGTAILEF